MTTTEKLRLMRERNTACSVHPDYGVEKQPTSKAKGCSCLSRWNAARELRAAAGVSPARGRDA